MLNIVDRSNNLTSLPSNLYYSAKCEDEVNEVLININKR